VLQPAPIRVPFACDSGRQHLIITSEGDLSFQFGSGRMLQRKPLIYQEGPRSLQTP